jgi:glycosyltransferase involved in cell wall biosynthesis
MRSLDNLSLEPLKVYSRAKNIPRKNLGLFRRLQSELAPICTAFNGYFDDPILPATDYVSLIDRYNCYICTSWQEGGPLPLMDAMRRGCTVLTTPVGQAIDLIEDGISGFFCRNFGEFKDRIETLSKEPKRLLEMRRQAQLAVTERSDLQVRQQLVRFLDLNGSMTGQTT